MPCGGLGLGQQGEMLDASWEEYATTLANAPSHEQLLAEFQSLASRLKINPSTTPAVIFARDTRESGPALVLALTDALAATGTTFRDHGLLTTPQLHYLVRCINTAGTEHAYGDPSEEGYYNKLADAYKRLMQGIPSIGPITVDCANGVGAPKLRRLAAAVGTDLFRCTVVNDLVHQPSKLNFQVGALSIPPLLMCCVLGGD